MDRRLLDWARAVKASRPDSPPPLWLFTDSRRLPDPRPAVLRLPPGLSGVVFRHDGAVSRTVLGAELARLCRARRIAFVVAGDARLATALRAGLHLRDGRRAGAARWLGLRRGLLTSSAHDAASARRAAVSGAAVIFISPVFPTASHPGLRALGSLRWARLARFVPGRAAALGGVGGGNILQLPRESCVAVGAIGALAP